MSRTITVDGSDITSLVRDESQVWSEVAYSGEVGIGGFNRDDTSGAGDVPALKAVTVTESTASPTRLFTGYISERNLTRGQLATVANQRQWDVTVLDLNTILDDEVFTGAGADRPEETDYERTTWLLTTAVMASLSIAAGPIPNTNTVTMDAIDYRGKTPRHVLDECAEMSGKNYFVYNHGSGHKLYYDKQAGTSLSSPLRISSVLADVDNTTTFHIETPMLRRNPARIYSSVRFAYEGGAVFVTDAGTEAAYRRREFSVEDLSVRTAAKATAKATRYLEAAATELRTFSCSVTVPSAKVNDIRAGQRIEIKVPHLSIAAFEWFRITRREPTPTLGQGGVTDEFYTLRLEFADDVLLTNFGRPRGTEDIPPIRLNPDTDEPEINTGTTDDPNWQTVCDLCDTGPHDPNSCTETALDDFNRSSSSVWGTASGGYSWTHNALGGGRTVGVDGAVGWVANTSSTGTISCRISGAGPWTGGVFDMKAKWRLTGAVGATALTWFEVLVADTTAGSVYARFRIPLNDLADGDDYNLAENSGAGFSGISFVPVLDTWYITRWQRDGTTARTRTWADGVTEPSSWEITLSQSAPVTPDFFGINFSIANPQTVEIDYINFLDCAPASGQQVTNEEVGLGDGVTVTFTTDYAFQDASLTVRVDGVEVTGSLVSMDGAGSEFTLDFAPEDDELIEVDYMAA